MLAIELAIVATTPFFELRFFAFFVVFDLVLGAVLDLLLVVAFFFVAVFAITDSATA